MVDQAELFRIADEILAEGRNPTVRALQTELSKGGSFSDVGPMFKNWSLARGFRPRPTKDDVPPGMLDSLSKVAAQIWSNGREQGRNIKLNEHEELIEKFDAVKMAYVAAVARVKALEERLGIAGNETESDGELTDAVPGRRGAAIAFWDGLLRKVAERMGPQHLNPDMAYLLLRPEDHQEAEEWSKNRTWSAAVLGDKMKGRAKEGKLFEALGANLYRRVRDEVDAAEDIGVGIVPPDPVMHESAEQPRASPTQSPAVRQPEPQPSTLEGGRGKADASPHTSPVSGENVVAAKVPLHSLMRLARDIGDAPDDDSLDKARFTIEGQSIARGRRR